MPARNRSLAITGLLIVALWAGALGGCGQKAATPPAAPVASTAVANLALMTPADKALQIASNFPLQVPVAAGSVVRGEAQGDSAWVYEIMVRGDLPAVRNWYLQAYRNAEWTIVSSADKEIALQKGGAQSRLTFENADTGSQAQTRVTAAVDVGTPVLQTQ